MNTSNQPHLLVVQPFSPRHSHGAVVQHSLGGGEVFVTGRSDATVGPRLTRHVLVVLVVHLSTYT